MVPMTGQIDHIVPVLLVPLMLAVNWTDCPAPI
jgi:hypothetical protein